jgi:hypothetical protein
MVKFSICSTICQRSCESRLAASISLLQIGIIALFGEKSLT